MVRWLAYSLVGWLVSWLVGWLVRWFVGWLADWLACWLSSWMASLLALLAQIAWLRFDGLLGSLVGLLTWFELASPLPLIARIRMIICLIRAWLAFEPFWSNFFHWDFQLRAILFKKWSWERFFGRPLYQCDLEIYSTTPQLDPNRKPIWFCKCKLRYTVWEIWESQLIHIRFSAHLKQLFVPLPSSLPSFTMKYARHGES